jgi:hypothetical protein
MKWRYTFVSLVLLALVVIGFASVYLLRLQTSGRIVVTGVLKQGVEAGCTILEADNGQVYTLIDLPNYRCGNSSASPNLGKTVRCLPPYGRIVKVTGYIERNAASYCMQGLLLHVESMTVLD